MMFGSWQDTVNGGYEILAGGFVANHARVLYADKEVKGVSVASVAFFFTWGIWNLYYYPHLGQLVSFFGGIAVATANCIWLSFMVYYLLFPGGRAAKS